MNPVLEMLVTVAKGLGTLCDEVVFVGGATVSLYSNKRKDDDIRFTDDIDCILEFSSRKAFNENEEVLRKKGFKHDTRQGAPVCRWLYKGIAVDVMPTKGEILGFSNDWYPEGFKNAMQVVLPGDLKIKILQPVYFIATKTEALKNRGMNDIRLSRDFDDIIAIIDFQDDIEKFIAPANKNLKKFIVSEIKTLIKNPLFEEAVYANLPPAYRDAGAATVIEKMKSLAKLKV